MIMSPGERSGVSCLMKSSTALPAANKNKVMKFVIKMSIIGFGSDCFCVELKS